MKDPKSILDLLESLLENIRVMISKSSLERLQSD